MSNLNWSKDGDRRRMRQQGVEDRAAGSRGALRRQADALLAGYTGPVTKVPAGARVTGSQVSGNVVRSVTGHVASEKIPSRHTVQNGQTGDLFGTAAAPRSEITGKSGNWSKKAKRNNRISDDPLSLNFEEKSPPPGLVLYADGACEPNPGAGGWGFVVYENGVEVHFDCGGADPTINNVMELTGALRALEWISAEHAFLDIDMASVPRLFCDSLYVVNGCNDWRHGWKKKGWRRGVEKELANADLWKELDATLTAVPIQLEWVKGHVGIVGNERADELSLMGRETVIEVKPDPLDLIRQQLDYSARGGA